VKDFPLIHYLKLSEQWFLWLNDLLW
jgi:hypothetical protein